MPTTPPTALADVNLSADCATDGHVFGLISGSVRHCERFGCSQRDAYDPDEFLTATDDLYDFDDPDRDQLGYDGPDAYTLK